MTTMECQTRGCRYHHHHDLDLEGHNLEGSGSLLKYLTRLLFVAILASCLVVFLVSLPLLSACRRSMTPMESLLDASQGQCSILGIPAYFACVVLVIAVFGFGCVGRRVSGVLLIATSTVAMLIAVVVVSTQECVDNVTSVRNSLSARLRQCGLYQHPGNSSKAATQLHRVDFLSVDLKLPEDCADTAWGLSVACVRQNADVAEAAVLNQTGLERCARRVALRLYDLCVQDSEVALPILLTVPVVYIAIGIGLIYIKQADRQAKSCSSVRTVSASLYTQTEQSPLTPGSTPVGQQALSRCLVSLCTSHSLCFTCLLRGHYRSCCSSSIKSPSSRLSFHLTQFQQTHQADKEEASKSTLGTHSLVEAPEELHLIDQCV